VDGREADHFRERVPAKLQLATFRRKNELFRRAPLPAKTKNTAGGGRREVVSRVELSESVLGAIVGLISALIAMLPQIVYAGLVAFGGAWIITN
jgi:hypothetical protein